MFLRNFYVRGWEFFKKIPTRRDFFGLPKDLYVKTKKN